MKILAAGFIALGAWMIAVHALTGPRLGGNVAAVLALAIVNLGILAGALASSYGRDRAQRESMALFSDFRAQVREREDRQARAIVALLMVSRRILACANEVAVVHASAGAPEPAMITDLRHAVAIAEGRGFDGERVH